MATRTRRSGFDVVTRGLVADRDQAALVAEVLTVLGRHDLVDTFVRARLTTSNCAGGPALAQVNLVRTGGPVRAQVPGGSVRQAIELVAGRLDRQLEGLAASWQARPWPDPQRRPLSAPSLSSVTRLKTCRLRLAEPLDAAAVLDAMDYDVHLFIDAESGEDAVVYRAGPSGLRLARQHGRRPPTRAANVMTVNPHRVSTSDDEGAADQLADGWLPFVFYTDLASGRGRLMYRRYDGGLGLVVPLTTGDRVGDPTNGR